MLLCKHAGRKLLLAALWICLSRSDGRAAVSAGETPVTQWILYGVIAVAAIIGIIAILNNRLLTKILGRLGHSTGEDRGPRPGEGAVIHHSSGEADFDGAPDKSPPADKDANRDLPYPPNRSAD